MRAFITVEKASGEYPINPIVRGGQFHFYFDIPYRSPVGKQLGRVHRRDRNCRYSVRLICDDGSVLCEHSGIPLHTPGLPSRNGRWLLHHRMSIFD